jgi:hypothetical protein
MYRWWKIINADFKSVGRPTIFQRNALVPFLAQQCPSLLRSDSEALPGEQGCAGGQPPSIFQDTDDIKKKITNEFT